MLPKSICIATPAYDGECTIAYTESLLKTCFALANLGIEFHYATSKASFVSTGRNALVSYMLYQTNASHILFIDGDKSWAADDLIRLLDHSEKEIVAALCPMKKLDWHRVAELVRENPEIDPDLLPIYAADIIAMPDAAVTDDVIEVDHAGAGIMLIARSVFERLAIRHPDWRLHRGMMTGSHAFFDGGRSYDGEFLGEDQAFCRDARQVGARVFVCPWLRIGHIGNYEFIGQPNLARGER